MPAVIDSAPECVTKAAGTEAARVEDSADFILQANYADCAGFGTFMPGSTYGPEGEAANTAYYILTYLGIAVTVLALLAWVIFENRRLVAYHAARLGRKVPRGETAARWRR